MGFSYLDDLVTMQSWEESEDNTDENHLTLAIFFEILEDIWENVKKKKREKQLNNLNIVFKIKN